jgi:hypothetical protein
MAAAAFATCTLAAYVAMPTNPAAAAVGSEIAVSDPVMETTTRAFNQLNFDAVFNGSTWFVVWGEDRGGDVDIMGARVGTDGSLPDGDGITISTGVNDTTKRTNNPSVALGSSGQYLVTWTNGDVGDTDVYAARVSSAGRVLDPAAIPISVGPEVDSTPKVAWNGSVFLIVYSRAGPPNAARAARVGANGVVQSLGEVDPDLTFVQVAALGSTFLVVGSRGIDNVAGRRIASDGTFLGASFPISPAVIGAQSQPSVAGGATQWVVSWTDKRNGDLQDVYAARVTADGTVLDPDSIQVSGHIDVEELPRVAMQGDAALIAWRDKRNGALDSVFAAHLSAAGVVAEPNGIEVSSTGSPSAARPGPGKNYTVVYARTANEAPYGGATRGFVRTVSPK